MYVLYVLFALLLFLPLFIYFRFPYVIWDVLYLLKGLDIAVRLRKFSSSTPCFTVLDHFLESVEKHPEKVFVLFEGRSYTYREADQLSSKVARALLHHTELKEGDTVALFLGNEPSFVWLWLGLCKLGCTAALLNTNIRTRSFLHCFTCSGAKTLITGSDLQEAVEEVLPVLKEQDVRVFQLGESCAKDGIINLSEKIDAASDEQLPRSLRSKITMTTPAVYIYTSGTTGLPKAAVITQKRMWMISFLQKMSGVCSDDIIYVYLPLYHSAGFLMGVVGAIERRITVVLRRKFSVSQFWNDCRKHNVTVIQYIGEIMRYLCNTPKMDSDRVHSVRLALGNGIRTDTWREFLQRFGDVRICECYGATEGNVGLVNFTGKIGALGRVNAVLKKLGGMALIKFDADTEEPVRDSKGFCVEVNTGETGLLVGKISKLSPFNGYANNRKQTDKKKLRNVFQQGDMYFNTGDLLRIDQEGFVYFQDRIGDTFRWKGENVATTEVADIMIMVDFIEEANVYGVRVPGHEGRIGMAAIKLKEGQVFDSSAVYKHLESFLPTYARPRFIRIQDVLDLTGTYKQMKLKLTEEGFDPTTIQDKMYFLDDRKKTYIPMSEDIFNSISNGQLRL